MTAHEITNKFGPEAEDLFHLVLLDENFLQTASLALLRKGYFFP